MTFTKNATTVTFNGAMYPVPYKSEPHQNYGESEDGTIRVYDRNVKVQYIELSIKDDHANLTNIRSFIETTANYRQNTFTFTPDTGHNAGAGDATAITVRYWDSNFVENQSSYHIYKYKIILRREVS